MAEMATTGNPTSINHIFDFDAPRTELDGPTYADLPTTGIHPRTPRKTHQPTTTTPSISTPHAQSSMAMHNIINI